MHAGHMPCVCAAPAHGRRLSSDTYPVTTCTGLACFLQVVNKSSSRTLRWWLLRGLVLVAAVLACGCCLVCGVVCKGRRTAYVLERAESVSLVDALRTVPSRLLVSSKSAMNLRQSDTSCVEVPDLRTSETCNFWQTHTKVSPGPTQHFPEATASLTLADLTPLALRG